MVIRDKWRNIVKAEASPRKQFKTLSVKFVRKWAKKFHFSVADQLIVAKKNKPENDIKNNSVITII
jgi:hypothetical protein